MTTIGIDLGTTNSACGIWTEDGVTLIPNRLGDILTPSVVSLDKNNELIVGRVARQRLINHSDRTVATFKRLLGSDHKVYLGHQSFSATELSSLILRSLREDAETFLGEPVSSAVISVPAYFSDNQRQATRQAAEIAGLNVERLINEPTAAAIAYGVHEKREGMFLILDFGGGTFDVSLLEYFDGIMEVHASAGDNFLGGEDFVDAMVADVLERNSLSSEQIPPLDLQNLYLQMEGAKRKLGPGQAISLKLGEQTIEFEVTQDWFLEICTPLLLRAKAPIERTLRDANIPPHRIDDVILVGGSTRLAPFRSMVGKMFGRLPSCHLDPDTVVAMGAAIQAGLVMRDEALDDVVLTDVCPFTLGTASLSGYSNTDLTYVPIIERNCVVPISIVRRLYTAHNNQRRLTVEVYQGESVDITRNIFLGKLTVRVPKGPAGQEAVDVRYTYDVNGILEVDVAVVSTGVTNQLVIERAPGAMSEAEKQQARAKLAQLKFHPREGEENRALLARAERIFESSLGERREFTGQLLDKFNYVLDRQLPEEIADFSEKMKTLLDQLENERWF